MSNDEFNNFKKIVVATVLSVLISAGGTALAFYYSTTERLRAVEASVEIKMDKTEFEYFQKNCYGRGNAIEDKFKDINRKLDRIENAIYQIRP